ncbi:type IV secretory system conjugative DNA transfer family protein [Spirosoma aerophilum]
MRDDRKELTKGNEVVLWFGLVILGLHFYIELHTFFGNLGWTHPASDRILDKLTLNSRFLINPWLMKGMAGALIVGYGAASRGVKSINLDTKSVVKAFIIGLIIYFGSNLLLLKSSWLLGMIDVSELSVVYLITSAIGILYLLKGSHYLSRLLHFMPGTDTFNRENETFPQEEQKIENDESVNIPTEFEYEGKIRKGWINFTNTFRSLLVMGTPGSGKSYGIVNSIIRQHIEKGFAMYIYDWKFPDLSLIAFNAMVRHRKSLPANMRFYCINFDDPQKSHRCNPLDPSYMPDVSDAYETAKIMMLNMNKTWIGKEGDIWADSAMNYTTALLWYLRCYKNGKYCTFPHLVELMMVDYRKLFPILMAQPDIEGYMSMFVSAYTGGAMEMLEGQINTARSGLAKFASPGIYWTMSANEFTLDINNPDKPKILCMANNSKKRNLYSVALGLYNARVLNQINIPGQHRCSIVIDELPTLYFQGLDDLIATGRGHKIAVTLSLQDYSQIESAYGKVEAGKILNTVGSVITGAVSGQTAKAMEERIGKNVQRKQSINIQTDDTTHGITTELAPMVPASKIGQLKAGHFVGVVAGAYGQEGDLKAFNAKVVIDKADFKSEQKAKQLPDFSIFAKQGTTVADQVKQNYYRIKDEVKLLVEEELTLLTEEVNLTTSKHAKKNGRRN